MLGVIEDQQGTGKNYRLDNGVRMIGKRGQGKLLKTADIVLRSICTLLLDLRLMKILKL